MQIHPVMNTRDLRGFISLPYQLYKNDPVWIPPLRIDYQKHFSVKTNPFLEHCEWQFFLLKDGKKILGRIAAFIDILANDFWKERVGLFGYFECIQDKMAANMLFEAARDWLKQKACTSMRGPWSFVSQEWGMVQDGFTPSPTVMAPYNPPYYNNFMTEFGLGKIKDLLCWQISTKDGYQIPERILRLTDVVQKRYDVRIRQINMKAYDQELETLIELSNTCLIENWGYSPVTDAEVRSIAKDMKPVIHQKGVLFAEDKNGHPIGFAIALPDVNVLLKGLRGRLFPFGILKLLLGISRLKQYRMFALGVIPEYQGKAVDSLIYRRLYESLISEDFQMEINYVLEDNWPMINGINKLGAKLFRRYRIYEMSL